MTVAIIDYGSGNLRSAAKAFEWAAAETGINGDVVVTSQASDVDRASHIVLPGVGAFADCKAGLDAVPGMVDALERNVRQHAKPFLGICVGMQLMAERGLEHGVHEGLGWIAGDVRRLDPKDPAVKIPHMGWNTLTVGEGESAKATGLTTGDDVYFVHSYHLICSDPGRCRRDRRLLRDGDRGHRPGQSARHAVPPGEEPVCGSGLIASFLRWRP